MQSGTTLNLQEDELHPLCAAAYFGDLENVKSILKNNVDVNCISRGVSPLWAAAQQGYFTIANELINHGANIDFMSLGQTPLWTAAMKGYTDIVTLLLKHGASINEICRQVTPLWIAVQCEHLNTIKALVQYQCDINLPHQGVGQTPLIKATSLGNILIVNELLLANANVNCVDFEGKNALHAACAGNSEQIVATLIKAGANINAETLIGRTPLSYANANKRQHLVNICLQYGSLPDLSQIGINAQFSKYLNFYLTLHPKKYNHNEIKKIKNQLEQGLCYGYLKIRRLMKDAGFESQLKQQYDLISSWDSKIESLENNQELEQVIENILFNVYALHRSDPLRYTQSIPIKDANLISLNNSYEKLFDFGFVFKYNELEALLQIILNPDVTINISHISKGNRPHVISIKHLDQDEYELFDSNANIIKPIKTFSLSKLINLLKLILKANSDCIGLHIDIEMISPSQEIKIKYLQLKNRFLDSLISMRTLNNEIDLNDENNLTSLFYAIYGMDIETAIKLLDNNATPCIGKEFIPPIYVAVQIGNLEIVKKMLKKGNDVNSTFGKDTLLHIATSLGYTNLVELLLSEKAVVDSIGNEGATALYIACQNGFYDIASALIKEKADVNFKLNTGHTPLSIAIIYAHSELVKLLITNGANFNQQVRFTTPIELAINKGHLDIVKILVEAGANLSNADGEQFALELAKLKGKENIVSYLNNLNKEYTNSSPIQTNIYDELSNSIIFFKNPNTKEGQDLIKNRHASYKDQREYDKQYGLIEKF